MRRFLGALALAACAFGAGGAAAQTQTLCDNPQAQCGRLLTPDCARLGAGAIAADDEVGAACATQLDVYRSCLALVAENCAAARPDPRAPSSSSDNPAQDFNEVSYRLLSCRRSTPRSVTCAFIAVNKGRNRRLIFRARAARAALPSGSIVEADLVRSSRRERRSFFLSLIPDVEVRFEWVFQDVPPATRRFQAVELFNSILWRNVTIVG